MASRAPRAGPVRRCAGEFRWIPGAEGGEHEDGGGVGRDQCGGVDRGADWGRVDREGRWWRCLGTQVFAAATLMLGGVVLGAARVARVGWGPGRC